MTLHAALRPIVAAIAVLAFVAVAIPVALVAWLLGIGWWLGIIAGVVAAIVAVVVSTRSRLERALSSFTGLAEADDERLANLVEGLSLSIGVEEPELYVVRDAAANAAALSDGDRQVVIVTNTLLSSVDRMGLEGVVAELLVRMKDGDAQLATEASGVLGPIVEGPLAPLLGSSARKILAGALDGDRDMLADQAAAAATRYPPGLAAALSTIETVGFRPATANRRNDHLWIVPPLGEDAVVPHVPLEWRVDMLLEI